VSEQDKPLESPEDEHDRESASEADTAEADAEADTETREELENSSSAGGYDDVADLFVRLAAAEPDSAEQAALRNELIARCIPLADHIARKFSGRGEPFDDLTQVARVGLVHAVDRFDISRGSNFLSFAVPTIMGEVRRYFRDNTWAMRVPRRVKETHLRIGAAVDSLSQSLGRSPTAKEIAAELDVDPDEVTQAVIAGNAYQPTSIDAASVGRDTDASLLDTLGEEEAQFDRVEEYVAIPDADRAADGYFADARIAHSRQDAGPVARTVVPGVTAAPVVPASPFGLPSSLRV
jgi:RNA polymerase sigma-B factor